MSISAQASPESRQKERDELARQIAEFQANGGEIEVLETPSGYCDRFGGEG